MFLESAGRPTVMADGTPASATGLMQIIPSTATALLGMNVDLARSLEINRELPRAQRRAVISRTGEEATGSAARGATRYCASARSWTSASTRRSRSTARCATCSRRAAASGGRTSRSPRTTWESATCDTVIRTYVSPRPAPRSTRRTVERYGLSWPQLYYDSSPTRNPRTWKLLTDLGDESRHYLFKVLASREILRLAREDPDELERQIALQTAKASAEEVLRPESRYAPYEDDADLRRAYKRDELVPLPERPGAAGLPARPEDGLAGTAARPAADPLPRPAARGARHPALPLEGVPPDRRQRGTLRVTSTVRDLPYQEELVRTNIQATSRVLAPHDRLRDRHRQAARGRAAALPARAPAGMERDLMGRGAGRLPPDRRPPGGAVHADLRGPGGGPPAAARRPRETPSLRGQRRRARRLDRDTPPRRRDRSS